MLQSSGKATIHTSFTLLLTGVPRLEPTVLEAIVDLTAELIDWEGIDLILGIEAVGLPLTAPLSIRTGIPMVIARKRSYGLEGEVEGKSRNWIFER